MTWLIINLLIAHVLGDFYFQTDTSCENKVLHSSKWWYLGVHAGLIGVLTWIAVWDACVWAWVLILSITISHFFIDWGKSWVQEVGDIHHEKDGKMVDGKNIRNDLWVFLVDQALHIGVIIVGAYFYIRYHEINNRVWVGCQCVHCFFVSHSFWVKISLAILLAIKPVNVLVLLILNYYRVKVKPLVSNGNNTDQETDEVPGTDEDPENKKNKHGNFHSGKLIGYLERCLILIFVVLSQYEAIGFLIAAKSILRFGEASSGTEKSEYVLAGTLLSLAFALLLGILVLKIPL